MDLHVSRRGRITVRDRGGIRDGFRAEYPSFASPQVVPRRTQPARPSACRSGIASRSDRASQYNPRVDDERSILKRGAKRTLWLRPGHGLHGDVVVKRFHAPGILRPPARSGPRRGREAHVAALFTRGLPVPEPIARRAPSRRRRPRHALDRRRPFARRDRPELRGMATSCIAREIGVLLARASLCGLRHPDLHAGNVLVDVDGGPGSSTCAARGSAVLRVEGARGRVGRAGRGPARAHELRASDCAFDQRLAFPRASGSRRLPSARASRQSIENAARSVDAPCSRDRADAGCVLQRHGADGTHAW